MSDPLMFCESCNGPADNCPIGSHGHKWRWDGPKTPFRPPPVAQDRPAPGQRGSGISPDALAPHALILTDREYRVIRLLVKFADSDGVCRFPRRGKRLALLPAGVSQSALRNLDRKGAIDLVKVTYSAWADEDDRAVRMMEARLTPLGRWAATTTGRGGSHGS